MGALRRFATWYVIGYLFVVGAFGYVIRELRHESIERDMALCEQGNRFREGLVASLRQADKDLVASSQESSQDLTSAEKVARQRSIDAYLARRERSYQPLKPREC